MSQRTPIPGGWLDAEHIDALRAAVGNELLRRPSSVLTEAMRVFEGVEHGARVEALASGEEMRDAAGAPALGSHYDDLDAERADA